jgi:acyl-CoA synthetase (NDP forming)
MVLAEDPVFILEAATSAVLDDANVDCAAIALAAGIERWASAVLDMVSRLRQRISKPVTIYVYGTQLSVSEEVVRQLGALGLPAYLELETAIKALGVAFEYATIKAKLNSAPRSG